MGRPKDHDERMGRARLALDGLSVGDAFGERFSQFPGSTEEAITTRSMPVEPWAYTGDTEMAIAVVAQLEERGAIDRDALAAALGARYLGDPGRGYDDASHWTLGGIAGGLPWQEAAESALEVGPLGDAAAIRAAPIGAYFADDLDAVVREATASTETTHARAESVSIAIAVAIASAIAARTGAEGTPRNGKALLEGVVARVPDGAMREALERARALLAKSAATAQAAQELRVSEPPASHENVALALYCAAKSIGDFTDAMWASVPGLAEREGTCAIAGAIVALANGAGSISSSFLSAREPLSL